METLPSNNPIRLESLSREELIGVYFSKSYSYQEISTTLFLNHGIKLSVRHLKRILRILGLRRKQIDGASPLKDVVQAVERELHGSGSSLGYKAMWKKITRIHGLTVKRDTILDILRLLDPSGIERRKSHRLIRRKYSSPGPNFIWHIDGYDKLKPFGFAIHGAIDGYSRKVLWLEVSYTNNDPAVVASYYLTCVKELGYVPRVVRCDPGTENSLIKCLQPFFRRHCDDALSGISSFIQGKSTSNQRIEAWWSILRKQGTDWWIAFFKDMRDSGIMQEEHFLHTACLQFCFMHLLQADIHTLATQWNLHVIQTKKNAEGESGKPDFMFYNPEVNGTLNYGVQIDIEDTVACLGECAQYNRFGGSGDFLELVKLLLPKVLFPRNADQAVLLYVEIMRYIKQY